MQIGLAFLGTNLIRCCKKAKVSFSMWGYGQIGLEAAGVGGRQGQGQMGLGAIGSGQRPHDKQYPRLPAITDQVRAPRSQPSLHRFPQADQKFLGGVEEGRLRQRLGGNFLSHCQAKIRQKAQSSCSNSPAPLQQYQVEANYLHAKQILGHPPLGFHLPPKNDKINFQCNFFIINQRT